MNAHVSVARVAANDSFYKNSGVCGHSTPSAYEAYAIFCVGNDMYREAAFKAWALSRGIGFKEMKGAYKGVSETSFMVNVNDLLTCKKWWENEESVLLLSSLYRNGRMYGLREAYLGLIESFTTDGNDEHRMITSMQHIGDMEYVTKEYALKQDAWTYDPVSELYWVARRRQHG